MENIIVKVEEMLKREERRKEIGELFLKKLTENLAPVIEKVYGDKKWREPIEKYRLWLWDVQNEIDLFFKYDNSGGEKVGFYYLPSSVVSHLHGTPLQELEGDLFWENVKDILDWLPLLIREIQKKDSQREAITDKIKNFVCDLEINKNKEEV